MFVMFAAAASDRKNVLFRSIMVSLEKSVSTVQFPVNRVIKCGPCWEAPNLWLVTYWQLTLSELVENGLRNTKTPAVISRRPFPFPRFRAFLPLPSPSPSPFCTCHAGYPSEQKTTLRPTNIISLSRRKYSLLFWRIWSGVTIAHFLIRFMGDL